VRKIKLTNETPWRTTELAAIIARVQAGAADEDLPAEIFVRCAKTNIRRHKKLAYRCSYFRTKAKYSSEIIEAEILIPCEKFPVRALAAVVARGFNLFNNTDHSLRPLQDRVRAVRVVKTAGQMKLTRVSKREERAPEKPTKQHRRGIYK
jgi:hypothetical protein